jgi:DUF4097 and DUF4098 domain-containing protein YvlB
MNWLISLILASSILSQDPVAPDNGRYRLSTRENPVVIGLDETERFEQTYTLNANGRVAVSNVNGSIAIDTWDANQVRFEAVKTADSKERLGEVEIKIDSKPDSFKVETDYKNFRNRGTWTRGSKLLVEFRLTVPKNAVLEDIETVNGTISITNAAGPTVAKAVNGQIKTTNLRGNADLSTVNGVVEADFEEVAPSAKISLGTVNGRVNLTVPSDLNATVKAEALNGTIVNDFGLTVRKGKYVGRDLYGKVGGGDAQIRLSGLNGTLSIKRRSDGRNPSPAVDLLPTKTDDPDIESNARIEAEFKKAKSASVKDVEAARRELERVRPEIEKAVDEAVRQSADAIKRSEEFMRSDEFRRMRDEGERLRREMSERFRKVRFMSGPPVIERKSGAFTVKGVPTVTVTAREAEVSIRGWDRSEVGYSVVRVADDKSAKPLAVNAGQTGSDVTIDIEDTDDPSCEDSGFTGESLRLEIQVPKKSNLRVRAEGEIRLENVSGDIRIEGGDRTVDVRDADGKLSIASLEGRIRVIGFRGDAETTTQEGETILEGDFLSLDAGSGDGPIVLTLPAGTNATVRSNTREVETPGFNYVFSSRAGDDYVYRIGEGGNELRFKTREGRVVIRSSSELN